MLLSFCHPANAHTSDSGLVLGTVHVINAKMYVCMYVNGSQAQTPIGKNHLLALLSSSTTSDPREGKEGHPLYATNLMPVLTETV